MQKLGPLRILSRLWWDMFVSVVDTVLVWLRIKYWPASGRAQWRRRGAKPDLRAGAWQAYLRPAVHVRGHYPERFRNVGRRWSRWIGLAAWTIVLCAAVTISEETGSPAGERDGSSDSDFSMTVRRVPGAQARASRCSDCTQPGDRVEVRLRGVSGPTYGVRVYEDADLIVSCDACASCDFLVPSIGRYEIVGVWADHECLPMASAGFDRDVAAMSNCEARLVVSRLVAR